MKKIETVAVIGLGYIGLPTAAILAENGVKVLGVDVSDRTVDAVNAGTVPFVEPSTLRDSMATLAGGRAGSPRASPTSTSPAVARRRGSGSTPIPAAAAEMAVATPPPRNASTHGTLERTSRRMARARTPQVSTTVINGRGLPASRAVRLAYQP